MSRPTFAVFGWSEGNGAIHRHRIIEPLSGLHRIHGIPVKWDRHVSSETAKNANVLLVHMPHTERALSVIRAWASLRTHRVIVDIDDNMWQPDYPVFRDYWTRERLDLLGKCARAADMVTTTTRFLAGVIREVVNPAHVRIMHNTLPRWVESLNRPDRTRDVVYQGSVSHMTDHSPGLFLHIAGNLPLASRLKIITDRPDIYARHPQIDFVPWQATEGAYYRHLADACLMIDPRAHTAFNRAKSDLRRTEAHALGLSYLPIHTRMGQALHPTATNENIRKRIDDWEPERRPMASGIFTTEGFSVQWYEMIRGMLNG